MTAGIDRRLARLEEERIAEALARFREEWAAGFRRKPRLDTHGDAARQRYATERARIEEYKAGHDQPGGRSGGDQPRGGPARHGARPPDRCAAVPGPGRGDGGAAALASRGRHAAAGGADMGLGHRLDVLEEANYVAVVAELRAAWQAYDWEVAPEYEGYLDRLPPEEQARIDADAAALGRLLDGEMPSRTMVDAAATALAPSVGLPADSPAPLVLQRWAQAFRRPPAWARH
jgi:hypothetical protein